MYPQRLPFVDGDDGVWGDIIRKYLEKEHFNDDTDNPANGGHKTVTIRAGTSAAGTAPLKFTSGTLMTTPEAGAIEFESDTYYGTVTTGAIRKKFALYDDTAGATGDIYYRNSSGIFSRLAIGNANDILTVNSGTPTWTAPTKPIYTPTATWGDSISPASVQAATMSYVRVPYSGTITEWHIIATASCDCTIDVWKAAGALPTNANSITASAKPSLASTTTSSSSTLTGWTTAVSAGDVLGFELENFSNAPTAITIVLKVQ